MSDFNDDCETRMKKDLLVMVGMIGAGIGLLGGMIGGLIWLVHHVQFK